MTEERKIMSMDPDDFLDSGLLDDANVLFKKVRYEMFDYAGKQDEAPVLAIDMVEDNGDETHQVWTVGSTKDWAPSVDGVSPAKEGPYLIGISSVKQGRKSTNSYLLFKSLLEAGFPRDILKSGNASTLEGTKAHVVRRPAPKREGLKKEPKKGKDGREYEATVLVVDAIISLPNAGTTTQKTEAAAKANKTAEDINAIAKDTIIGVLASHGGSLAMKEIVSKCYEALGTDPRKNQITALIMKPQFLKEAGFTVADGIVNIG